MFDFFGNIFNIIYFIIYIYTFEGLHSWFAAPGVQSMRGSKWQDSATTSHACVLALSRECEGQPGGWFTKSSFIEHVTKLDKKRSGHIKHFKP